MKTFGERVRFYRIRQGLTQVELAERLGVTDASVCQVERRSGEPHQRTLEAYARALHVFPHVLVDDNPPRVMFAKIGKHRRGPWRTQHMEQSS